MTQTKKEQQLGHIIRDLLPSGVCIAYSGGTDSSTLLATVCRVRDRLGGVIIAVRMRNTLQDAEEGGPARRLAEDLGVAYVELKFDPLHNPAIRNNPPDRCYQCKKQMLMQLQEFARIHQLTYVLDGTNWDDRNEYRPGRRALKELEIRSPLLEANMTKAEVRELAAKLKVPAADKSSDSCLATRLPYGTVLDQNLLRKIQEGEQRLYKLGFPAVRLRLQDPVARIEVPADRLADLVNKRESVVNALKDLGFVYVTLDLEGFRSGSMDLLLPEEVKQRWS